MTNSTDSLVAAKNFALSFGRSLYTHQRMIYFILFVCALIGAILGLNLALNQPSDEAYRSAKMSETQSPKFDTQTIEKIQTLNAKQQTNTDPAPTGQRTNPFGE